MEEGSVNHCRVLAADDDNGALRLYAAALAGASGGVRPVEQGDSLTLSEHSDTAVPIELVLAHQGDEALELVRQAKHDDAPFAVVFLDVSMPPGPDGVWAAEQIRAIDSDVHIILATASDDIDLTHIGERIPPRDKLLYVHKPLEVRELQSLAAAFGAKFAAERLVKEYQRGLEDKVERRTADLARMIDQLRRSQVSLSRAQRLAHLGSWELDLSTGRVTCSAETLSILGRTPDDPPRSLPELLQHLPKQERGLLTSSLGLHHSAQQRVSLDHHVIRPNDVRRVVHQEIEVVRDRRGEARELHVAMQDITRLRRSEEQILYQAFHDSLTGLPNRQLFTDRLQVAIAHARRRRQRLAVLSLDLDDFKTINDSLGHELGDQLLLWVSQRLKMCVREEDTVARVGGDEFLILLESALDPSYAVHVAQRVLEALAGQVRISEHEIFTRCSIGITMFPDDASLSESLIANADIAMYRAKEQGGNTHLLFTPAMNELVTQRLELETSLRKALDNNELLVYYQPMVDIASGKALGVEALVRWQRPGRGLVGPESFIPLAEETGLIVPIGEWVLATACATVRAWHAQGLEKLELSVNLSPRQFQLSNIVDMVAGVLRRTGFPPGCLVLEVTEGAVMGDVEEAIETMGRLRQLGVRLSMDDFGYGYSSLCHLKRFPMSTLKIDRSFVADLETSSDDASIVRAIIALSRSLRLQVIAEGVETQKQLDFLILNQCDQVQGFLFGHPSPQEEAMALLKRPRLPVN